MISDIDSEGNEIIVKSSADVTRVSYVMESETSYVIGSETDQTGMQKTIYKWAEVNLMEFNEDKFKQ